VCPRFKATKAQLQYATSNSEGSFEQPISTQAQQATSSRQSIDDPSSPVVCRRVCGAAIRRCYSRRLPPRIGSKVLRGPTARSDCRRASTMLTSNLPGIRTTSTLGSAASSASHRVWTTSNHERPNNSLPRTPPWAGVDPLNLNARLLFGVVSYLSDVDIKICGGQYLLASDSRLGLLPRLPQFRKSPLLDTTGKYEMWYYYGRLESARFVTVSRAGVGDRIDIKRYPRDRAASNGKNARFHAPWTHRSRLRGLQSRYRLCRHSTPDLTELTPSMVLADRILGVRQ